MDEFKIGQTGLKLAAPSAGDIVTVKLKPCPRTTLNYDIQGGSIVPISRVDDESMNPQHYRHTNIWRVLAVNGGQAVVEAQCGYDKGRVEIWPIDAHDWFEAGDLWAALGDERQRAEMS